MKKGRLDENRSSGERRERWVGDCEKLGYGCRRSEKVSKNSYLKN